MALADELLSLRQELASATSPLQRMKMLARSWRTLRQLTPEERKRLATAVGAEGAEGILDKLAARKGRVGPAFLAPALEKLKEMDADALARLVEVVRDPQQRRDALRKSADAVSQVLVEEQQPVEAAEEQPPLEEGVDLDLAEPESEEAPQEQATIVIEEISEGESPAEIEPPTPQAVGPRSEPTIVAPPREVTSTPEGPPEDMPELERVRQAPTLARRLALAREVLDKANDWSCERLLALIEIFPQAWARRRIVADMLRRRIPRDATQAIELVDSLQSRASRRWCVSLLLHDWQLSDSQRQQLRERI